MKENPIATRTKDSIEAALIALMGEMPYRNISIRALTVRAGLSRQAFYTHFREKDDVLVRHMLSLLADILTRIRRERIDTVEKLVGFYTSVVEENAAFFRLLVDNDLTGLVRRVYSRYLVALPPVLGCQRENRSESERKYFNVFWVAAFIEVYAAWLAEDRATARAEIVSILSDLMQGSYFPPEGGRSIAQKTE